MKKLLCALVLGALVSVGLSTAPAQARRGPGHVDHVRVVAATRTSLTVTWPKARGAKRYVVERGRGLDMGGRKDVGHPKKSKLTVKGLTPDRLYCFQVRAKNHKRLGDRSRRSCQYPAARQQSRRGASYRVVTYNVCGVACKRWEKRRKPAASLVRRRHPAVVALQESPPTSGMARAIGGMTQTVAHSGKALLYRTKRFTVAKDRRGHARKGVLDLGRDPRARKHRFAVWAELVDRRHSRKHVVFVSVHLSPGGDTKRANRLRSKNTRALVRGLQRVNPARRPVVVAGDFNSNQGRDHDAPGRLMSKQGLDNAFFVAHRWNKPNYNSATQDRAKAIWGTPWGYHVDQVWVNRRRAVVKSWTNAARVRNGRYPTPQISNHSPVLVKVKIT